MQLSPSHADQPRKPAQTHSATSSQRTSTSQKSPHYRLVGEIDGRSASFQLISEVTAIGSHGSNDLILSAIGVSRSHAVLRLTPDGAIVEDRGSKNGTWVNDRRVVRAHLASGDRLHLGTASLRLEVNGPGGSDSICCCDCESSEPSEQQKSDKSSAPKTEPMSCWPPQSDSTEHAQSATEHFRLKDHVAQVERRIIRAALAKTGGNRALAAQLLEISTDTLVTKIEAYELE